MRHLRAIIIGVVLLVLLALGAWQMRAYFLQNKVTFLLNQKQYSEALKLVDKLTGEDPANPRIQFLRIKTLTLTEKYTVATRLPLPQEVSKNSPEVLYWRALAHWQLGEDGVARQLAEGFIESGERLHERASMLIVENLAGKRQVLPLAENGSRSYRLLFPLEQAVYQGIAGQQEMELGRVDRATKLFGEAFVLGNRNKGTLLAGAEASAIAGNAQQASMLLAFSGVESVEVLYQKMMESYEEYKSTARTIQDQEVAGRGGKVDLARALAWAATVYLAEDTSGHMYPVLRIMADLQQEYPYDRIVTSRMAQVLETLKRYDEAYALYKRLYEESPNLVTGLRMWSLEVLPEAEITKRIVEFLEGLRVVDSITPAGFTGFGYVEKAHYLSLHNQAAAQSVIKVPENGSYLVTLIARGENANGQWPLVKITVDGELVEYRYIRREAWDCYSMELVLDAGLHDVEIDYVNGCKELSDETEVRSFYLRAIYVTNSGVV